MRWLKSLFKRGAENSKRFKLPEEDLPRLLERYKAVKTILNWKPRHLRTEDDLAMLKDSGSRIIVLLPDEFQRGVFSILSQHNLDFCEFLDDDWVGVLKKGFKDFLLWMLHEAKYGDSQDYIKDILEPINQGNICGQKITDQRLKEQIFSLVIVVLMSGEYRTQFRVLVEIFKDLPDGEKFVRERLAVDNSE